jgi:uncharacterized protein (TIGR02757 family)
MDPLWIPQAYSDPRDIETSAWVASVFAFGQVKAFLPILQRLQKGWGPSPYAWIKEGSAADFSAISHGIYYRWYKSQDITKLFTATQKAIATHGSLQEHAQLISAQAGGDFERFVILYAQSWRALLSPQTRGQQFMVPDPAKKSTMKRLLMYLRWMIHPHVPDFGLWPLFDPTNLWMALDTHMFQFAKQFGWTQDKTPSLKTVKEVSEVLSKLHPDDPMRLDFQLTQMGILRQCLHHYQPDRCHPCPLQSICTPIQKKEPVNT